MRHLHPDGDELRLDALVKVKGPDKLSEPDAEHLIHMVHRLADALGRVVLPRDITSDHKAVPERDDLPEATLLHGVDSALLFATSVRAEFQDIPTAERFGTLKGGLRASGDGGNHGVHFGSVGFLLTEKVADCKINFYLRRVCASACVLVC